MAVKPDGKSMFKKIQISPEMPYEIKLAHLEAELLRCSDLIKEIGKQPTIDKLENSLAKKTQDVEKYLIQQIKDLNRHEFLNYTVPTINAFLSEYEGNYDNAV